MDNLLKVANGDVINIDDYLSETCDTITTGSQEEPIEDYVDRVLEDWEFAESHPSNDHSTEALLEALRQKAATLGRTPEAIDISRDSNMPPYQAYIECFGEYRLALWQAGLAFQSKDELLFALCEKNNQLGRKATIAEVEDDPAMPPEEAYCRTFGSWKNALLRASWLMRKRERTIALLHQEAKITGRTFWQIVNRNDDLATKVKTQFGSLDILQKEYAKSYFSKGGLIDLLCQKTQREGSWPTRTEVSQDPTLPPMEAFCTHFGAWNIVSATAKAQFKTEQALLAAICDKAQQLGRIPTQEEVASDPEMPLLKEYLGCFHKWRYVIYETEAALSSQPSIVANAAEVLAANRSRYQIENEEAAAEQVNLRKQLKAAQHHAAMLSTRLESAHVNYQIQAEAKVKEEVDQLKSTIKQLRIKLRQSEQTAEKQQAELEAAKSEQHSKSKWHQAEQTVKRLQAELDAARAQITQLSNEAARMAQQQAWSEQTAQAATERAKAAERTARTAKRQAAEQQIQAVEYQVQAAEYQARAAEYQAQAAIYQAQVASKAETPAESKPQPTREELIQEILTKQAQLGGRMPTQQEVVLDPNMSSLDFFIAEFGDWTNALWAALGIKEQPKRRWWQRP